MKRKTRREEITRYSAEDYAFCQRSRECGFAIVADTTIRLWHVGTYAFGWEDAGIERQRHARFTLHFPGNGEDERAGARRTAGR